MYPPALLSVISILTFAARSNAAPLQFSLPAPVDALVTDNSAFEPFAREVQAAVEHRLQASPAPYPSEQKLLLGLQTHLALHWHHFAEARAAAAAIREATAPGPARDFAGLTTDATVAAQKELGANASTDDLAAAFRHEFRDRLAKLPRTIEMAAVLELQLLRLNAMTREAILKTTADLNATVDPSQPASLATVDEIIRLHHRLANVLPLIPVMREELRRVVTSLGEITVNPAFPGITFHNLAAIDPADDGEGYILYRVPKDVRRHLNPIAQTRSRSPAGVELRFRMTNEPVQLTLKLVDDRGTKTHGWPVWAEIRYGDLFAQWVEVNEAWTTFTVQPPPDLTSLLAYSSAAKPAFNPALVRILLPYTPETRLQTIQGTVLPPQPDDVPERRYLAYGSSITNGFYAARPGETYPAGIGRALGVDVINLGFGGGAYLEPEMADWIAGRTDWEFATLELGVNLLARISVEEFRQRTEYFIQTIAAAHPDQWIFCIDIFPCFRDFDGDPKVEAFRRVVRDTVARLHAPRVVHLDGRQLLQNPAGLIADRLHPSSEGFAEITQRLVEAMRPHLKSTDH